MRRHKPTGEEYKDLTEQYLVADREKKAVLAARYGISVGTLINWMAAGDTPPVTVQLPPEPAVINLPPVKLKEYKPSKVGKLGDPETQVLLLSDLHSGEVTPTFNPDILSRRLNSLYQSTLSITHLHRNMYPVNNLVIFDLGDNVHGENPYQGGKIGNVTCGAQEQVFDIAMPEIINLLYSFRQEFDTVEFYGVPGNHGRYSKEAPETSNWDTMLYKALAATRLPDGVSVHSSEEFYEIVNVQGFDFFLFHGDSVKSYQGIPFFGVIRKLQAWYITHGGFPYACCGHWHTESLLRINSKLKLFMNGSLVSDDPYALRVVGTSSIPAQWTFGVHERHGVTWAYALHDEEFLPERKIV